MIQKILTPTQVARELRKNMTAHERILWNEIRNRKLGFKFTRQKPIIIDSGKRPVQFYIVDFYCAEKKLILEIDGKIHLKEIEKDLAREQELMQKGYSILRFGNEELKRLEDVVSNIKKRLLKL